MAVIVAGLAIGARRARITTAQTRLQLHSVYQTVIFLLESVVFSLIGLQLPTLIRALSHAEAWPADALAVAGTLIATRILWVFPLSAVIQRRSGTRRPSWAVPAVVSWAGTRGVVPLAAALSIPLTSASGAPLPQRDLILVLATAVIVVSLIVQGLTLEPLARFAGIARPAAARHEETIARLRLAEAALARLDELADGTPPLTRSSTGSAPACRPASGAPAPASTAPHATGTGRPDRTGPAPRPHRRRERRTHPALRQRHHQRANPPAAAAQPRPGGHPAQRRATLTPLGRAHHRLRVRCRPVRLPAGQPAPVQQEAVAIRSRY